MLVQALYAWQLSGNPLQDIAAQLLSGSFEQHDEELPFRVNHKKIDNDYFVELIKAIPQERAVLDDMLVPIIPIALEEVTPMEHAILWLGAYELTFKKDVPFKVAINESVELAKIFGAQESHRFINGVLDKLSKNLNAPI